MSRDSKRTGWSRRGLLRGGAAIAGVMAMPGCAMAQGRRISPGQKIKVGWHPQDARALDPM